MYYLLDNELNFITPIEGYKSMIWTTRHYDAGDFELQIEASEKWLHLFGRNYFIVRDDDNFKQAMIIENIKLVTDVEDGNYIFVTGRDLKSILARRVIFNKYYDTNTELRIRNLVNGNCITTNYLSRIIPNLILAELKNYTAQVDSVQINYGENLLDAVALLCRNGQLGFDITLKLETKQFVFDVLKCEDRSYNQTKNPYVVFSDEFENLLRTETTFNYIDPYNSLVAYDRITTDVSGFDRVEKYVELQEYQENVGLDFDTWNDRNTPYLVYNYNDRKYAWERAKNTIRPRITKMVSAEIETNHTWVYRKDYFVGDIVEVVNEYGIRSQPRIIEVIESEDTNGSAIVVTLETEEDEVTLSGSDEVIEIPEEETEV